MKKKILFVDDDCNFVSGIMNSHLKDGDSFSYADSIDRAEDLLLIDNFDLIIANSRVPGGSSLLLKNKINSSTEICFISALESDYNSLNHSGEKCYRKYELSSSIDKIFANA
jgi:DNA-binding response OmpR family regulator